MCKILHLTLRCSASSQGTPCKTWSGLNKSSSSKEFTDTSYWHILLCWLTLRFRATYLPGHKTGKTLHFWKSALLSFHPALISGRDLENRIASKWGVACAWNAATFPLSLWHGSHYTEDVAFLLSLSSLFSLSNDFFWSFGQIRPPKSQFKCSTVMSNRCTESANVISVRDLQTSHPSHVSHRKAFSINISKLVIIHCPSSTSLLLKTILFREELTTVRSCHAGLSGCLSCCSVLICLFWSVVFDFKLKFSVPSGRDLVSCVCTSHRTTVSCVHCFRFLKMDALIDPNCSSPLLMVYHILCNPTPPAWVWNYTQSSKICRDGEQKTIAFTSH